MKKILLFISVAGLLMFSSCVKDRTKTEMLPASIKKIRSSMKQEQNVTPESLTRLFWVFILLTLARFNYKR